MRKNVLKTLSLFSLFIGQLQATEGIILVLEAPLLKEPSMGATVLQTLRKGAKVYVPNEVTRGADFPEFIPTFDRAGNRAYIPSRYVKIITGLPNESRQAINFQGHDPTDYRLEEPIPKTYPFPDRQYVRASFSFQRGNNTSTPYDYNSNFSDQKYGGEMGVRVGVMKNVSYDKYNRFYFGIIGSIASAKNEIVFSNTTSASERRNVFRVGPWFTYDAFKSERFQISLGSGFTFNYHDSTISFAGINGGEDRSFSGYSFSPMTSTAFQISNIIPYTDFIGGVDCSLYLPHTLKASEAQYPEYWNSNQISSTLKVQLALFLGIQVKY